MHNIVKRFRESSKISVYIGKGRTPQLNVWSSSPEMALHEKQSCCSIKYNRMSSGVPLSLNPFCRCIIKCNLNLYLQKKKSTHEFDASEFSRSKFISDIQKDCANVCSAQMTEMSTFQLVFRGKLVSASDVTPTDRWLNVWAHIFQASKNYSQEHCFN